MCGQVNKDPILGWKVLRHVARQYFKLHSDITSVTPRKLDLEEVVHILFPEVGCCPLSPCSPLHIVCARC